MSFGPVDVSPKHSSVKARDDKYPIYFRGDYSELALKLHGSAELDGIRIRSSKVRCRGGDMVKCYIYCKGPMSASKKMGKQRRD